jgi:hypothetical protein
MTHQDAERAFLGELKAAIKNARANGLAGNAIAYKLRSVAYDISKQWRAECDRRKAERIEQMTSQK